MSTNLRRSIAAQRAVLHDLLAAELARQASEIPPFLGDRQKLDARLQEIFRQIEHCKYVYVLDSAAVQISSTVNRYGADTEAFHRDRSQRPRKRGLSPKTHHDYRCQLQGLTLFSVVNRCQRVSDIRNNRSLARFIGGESG